MIVGTREGTDDDGNGMSYETQITQVSENPPYHSYNIFALYSKDVLAVSAQTMLDIAAYVEAHRPRIEREAEEDREYNAQAIAEDYRHAKQGGYDYTE